MAFKEISLVLTNSDQDIAVVEADRQAVARFTITNNNGSSARTYTLKHYKAATATTVTLRNAFNINALSAVDIPAISLNEGDKIIASASASDVVISGAFHDTAKAVPFEVSGIDGVDPGYPWNFRDKTDVEEPDAVGDLNFNNAVLADVTKIALSAQSSGAGNPDLSDIIESWDDNGESANRGRLLLKNRNAPAQTAEFRLTGTVTYHDEAIDWYELDVEFIGGPGLSTDAELSVQFFDAGEEGAAGVSGASAMTKVDVVDTDDGDPDTDYEDGDEIDGVTLEANMLVLRASSSDPELNGVYVVPVSGAAARHSDFDDFDDLPGSEFNILSGDTYGGTKWRCFSEKGGTIDTDSVTINQVTSMDGTQNLSDVADVATAFNNIKQSANESYEGVVELATTEEAIKGAGSDIVITPIGAQAVAAQFILKNGKITESRSGNAVTFHIKGLDGNDPSGTNVVGVMFPDGTQRTLNAALSVTVSSGSTLGAANNEPFNVWVVLIDDSGTLRLGVRNCSSSAGVYGFPGNGVLSSTAEGGAGGADSIGVTYTGTAVSSKQFVIVGYAQYDSGLATAGTWNAAPSRIVHYAPGMHKPGDLITSHIVTSTSSTSTTASVFGTPATTGLAKAISLNHAANVMRFNVSGCVSINSSADAFVQVFRDTSVLSGTGVLQTDSAGRVPVSLFSFSKPGTTASATYSVKVSNGDGASTVVWNPNTLTTCMEVRELQG